MVRKMPWWLPRKLMVIDSRTRRAASGSTSRVTAKRSMENDPDWAAAGAVRARIRETTQRAGLMSLAPEGHRQDLLRFRAVQFEVGARTKLEEAGHRVRGKLLDGRVRPRGLQALGERHQTMVGDDDEDHDGAHRGQEHEERYAHARPSPVIIGAAGVFAKESH